LIEAAHESPHGTAAEYTADVGPRGHAHRHRGHRAVEVPTAVTALGTAWAGPPSASGAWLKAAAPLHDHALVPHGIPFVEAIIWIQGPGPAGPSGSEWVTGTDPSRSLPRPVSAAVVGRQP
jgi:hypothetical protein